MVTVQVIYVVTAARRQIGAGVDTPEGSDGAETLFVSDLRRVRESVLPELRRGGCRVSASLKG